jgi:hypothetical protein
MSGSGPLLSDYSGYRRGGADELTVPRDTEEVRDALLRASAARIPVRIRGNGHAMTGANIPCAGEMVLSTASLLDYHFGAEGTVTVGSGATVWDVTSLSERFGYQLPVVNDGDGPAPTVGGFTAAGGFGVRSERFGGFWESVREMVVVTGDGRLVTLRPDDDAFRWMFGSMGQLGIVVAATVALVPRPGQAPRYPLGRRGRVQPMPCDHPRRLWCDALVPGPLWPEAKMAVRKIGLRHARAWQRLPAFHIRIPFRTFTPPLVSPYQGDLVALGIWGDRPPGGFDWERVRLLDREFTAWVRSDPRIRRYASGGLLFEDFDYTAHFGAACLRDFAAVKRDLDPLGLLVRGPLSDALRACGTAGT